MSDLDKVMKAGDLLVLETGDYDGRDVHEPLRLKGNASRRQLANAYLGHWRRPEVALGRPEKYPPARGFRAWLIAAGWAEEVLFTHTWAIGDGESFHPNDGAGVWPEDGG
jgi:hypothetical protein